MFCDDRGNHYRIEHPRSGVVYAILNDGHNGTVLNCKHPSCVAVRDDVERGSTPGKTDEREPTKRGA